jgi:hypothetical protein
MSKARLEHKRALKQTKRTSLTPGKAEEIYWERLILGTVYVPQTNEAEAMTPNRSASA